MFAAERAPYGGNSQVNPARHAPACYSADMAGARIEIELKGLDRVQKRLNELARRLEDPTDAFADIGEYVVEQTDKRIRAGVSPDGTPWPPLTEATRRSKKKNKDKPLLLTGALFDSIHAETGRTGVVVGSDRKYAATHQFGRPAAGIPARPFLGLSDADIAEIERIISDHLDRD